jgi:hypothetical protein
VIGWEGNTDLENHRLLNSKIKLIDIESAE